MDFINVIKSTVNLFIIILNTSFTVGGLTLNMTAVFVFVGCAYLVIRLLRGLSD